MPPTPQVAGSTMIPAIRYLDAPAAIEWLCRAFGFEKHAVYEDSAGGIAHAQLTFGSGMIMVGSLRDDAWGARVARSKPGGSEPELLMRMRTLSGSWPGSTAMSTGPAPRRCLMAFRISSLTISASGTDSFSGTE